MKKPKCLRPDCKRPSKVRGLCGSDYQCAQSLVAQKRFTWAQLEKAGKALPVRHERGKGTSLSWFVATLTGKVVKE